MGSKTAQLIRTAREARGLSQSDLSKALQLKSAQFISNIERGISPVPRKMIPLLQEYLGLEREELIDAMLDDMRTVYETAAEEGARSKGGLLRRLKFSKEES